MRRIISAISVLALAFSLVASATSANAAVAGYDSAYAGESAFLNLAPGQSGTFTVFFANTGSTSWVRGSASQVDLATCLDNKVTCNAQDASEAPFNSGWLSATRYATHTQSTVAPGGIGTFTYNVAVPAAQAAGTYRFNGALVLSSTGADIRNEGYYQDVTVTGPTTTPPPTGTAAVLTSLSPTSGSTAGGTSVTITGTGFVCTPTFPTVNFGTTTGTVTSCGASSIVAISPARAAGPVQVTVANAGGAASNGLTFTYADTVAPTYDSVSVQSGTATLTFSEPVCRNAALVIGADLAVSVNGIVATVTGNTAPLCDSTTAATNAVTSFKVFFTAPAVAGDTVAVTITGTGAPKIQDAVGNTMTAAQTRTATATADTTPPSISTAAATSTTTVKLTYTERVRCTAGAAATAPQFTVTSSTGTPVAQPATLTDCTTALAGATTITITFANAISTSGTVTYATGADPVRDLAGNIATSPQTVSFGAFVPDTTAPLSQDIRILTNTNFNLDSADVFTVAFNEVVVAPNGATIRLTDADGTIADVICGTIGGVPATRTATCAISTAATTIGGVSYPTGTVITVTMVAEPTIVAIGTVTGLQIPATVIGSLLITDTAGNNWDIANSPDKILN